MPNTTERGFVLWIASVVHDDCAFEMVFRAQIPLLFSYDIDQTNRHIPCAQLTYRWHVEHPLSSNMKQHRSYVYQYIH